VSFLSQFGIGGGGGRPVRVVKYDSPGASGNFVTNGGAGGDSWCRITLVGGGGGGGACTSTAGSAGGGGGGGQTVQRWVLLTGTIPYAVGAGGAGGISGFGGGQYGSNTTLGVHVAAGGQGGSFNAAANGKGGYGGGFSWDGYTYDDNASGTQYSEFTASVDPSGVAGGAGGDGTQGGRPAGINGASGAFVQQSTSGATHGGGGGGTLYGAGANGLSNATPSAPSGHGGGGGGAGTTGTSRAGGPGAGGLILIEEFGPIRRPSPWRMLTCSPICSSDSTI
jgi:hypothetical protein